MPIATRLKQKNMKRNFPQKLFDLLQTGFHNDIVKWLPGGTAFIVLDKRRFTNDILPNYFKDSQYTSFTRKLSRWKFTRVSRGPYIGAYYHKHFRSDNRSLCKLMSCNDSKNKLKTTKATESADESDVKAEAETEQTVEVPRKREREAKDDIDVVSISIAAAASKMQEDSPVTFPASAEREPHCSNTTASSLVQRDREPHFSTTSSLVDMNNNFLQHQAFQLRKSMQNTNNNIQFIKQQLMEIRLRKARVEKKKKLLMMQAEADRLEELKRIEVEASRLRVLNRIKNAIDTASRQDTENHIIAAAARALDRCDTIPNRQPSVLQPVPNETLSFSLWQLQNAQFQQTRNNHMGGNRQRDEENDLNSRAFAA